MKSFRSAIQGLQISLTFIKMPFKFLSLVSQHMLPQPQFPDN